MNAAPWYRTRRLVGDLLQHGRAWWPTADKYQRIALGPILHRLAEDYDRVNRLFPPGETHSTLAQREAARSALLASATATTEAVSEVCGARGVAAQLWTTSANLAYALSLIEAEPPTDGDIARR